MSLVLSVVALPWGIAGAFAPFFVYFGTGVYSQSPPLTLASVIGVALLGFSLPVLTIVLSARVLRRRTTDGVAKNIAIAALAIGIIACVAVISGSLPIVFEAAARLGGS
ncbi:hypothetical protein GCM10027416_25820 [Okibacterium endophyticum]